MAAWPLLDQVPAQTVPQGPQPQVGALPIVRRDMAIVRGRSDQVEPNAVGVAALHSPETAITDYRRITRALLDAHDAGIRTADLFGLAPPDEPNHPWAGFSAFKRSFGGEDVTHLGTWERDIVPGARRALEAREHLAERRQTQRARGPEATADSSAPVASTVATTASAENSSVPH